MAFSEYHVGLTHDAQSRDGAAMEHIARRPDWSCVVDGQPYPCRVARKELTAENSPTRLAVFMWAQLEEAAHDLPNASVGEMFERFLKWTWYVPRAGGTSLDPNRPDG